MEAIREIVSAETLSPIINLPWKSKGLQVEVIVVPYFKEKYQRREVSVESLEGCLRAYANPALWEKEKHAWENHVAEKYGNI